MALKVPQTFGRTNFFLKMNSKILIVSIAVIVIIIIVIVVVIDVNKRPNPLGDDILNSVYMTDGYFVYYVPLMNIFENLIKIANIDPNYTPINKDKTYTLTINNQETLKYISCSVSNEKDVVATSDFTTQYIDKDLFGGNALLGFMSTNEQKMVKNIVDKTLNMAYYKGLTLDINNKIYETNSKSLNIIQNNNPLKVEFTFENGKVTLKTK